MIKAYFDFRVTGTHKRRAASDSTTVENIIKHDPLTQ